MAVSVANFAGLKARVQQYTGQRSVTFDRFFPSWLNEIIRRCEEPYPLSYMYRENQRVTLSTNPVSVENLIATHPYSLKVTLDDLNTLSNSLIKRNPIELDTLIYEREDYGIPTQFSETADPDSPNDVVFRLYPPTDDDTRELVIAGYYFSTRTTWNSTDTNWLIANKPLLLVYGIASLVYQHDQDYQKFQINHNLFQSELFGKAEEGVQGLHSAEWKQNEQGEVQQVTLPTQTQGRGFRSGPESDFGDNLNTRRNAKYYAVGVRQEASGLGHVVTDSSIDGDGTSGNPLSLDIQSDSTLSGKGTTTDPLSAVGGGGGLSTVSTGTGLDGDGSTGNPITLEAGYRIPQVTTQSNDSLMQVVAGGWARVTGIAASLLTSGTLPSDRIATGGSTGEVVTKTAAGQEWAAPSASASQVGLDSSNFGTNLSGTDDDVQTAMETIDDLVLGMGGGGGEVAVGEQRIESVSFADITNITSTAMALTLAATDPIAVEFGEGDAEILSGTAGETTFTVAESGVYLFEFSAVYPADGDRTTPFVEIQQNSDDAVIGRSTNTYLRNSGSPEDSLIVVVDGIVTVPTDSLVVKAVLGNSYNQNSLDANSGKLSLVRINSGLRGAAGQAGTDGVDGIDGGVGPTGPAGTDGADGTDGTDGTDGMDGAGQTFNIHGLDAETTIAAADSIAFSDASDSNTAKRITGHNLGTHLAATGLQATATGQLELALNEPALTSTVADTDVVVLGDASDSFNTKRATLETLGTHFGTGGGGGGGTDDQTAAEVTVDTANFSQNLTSTDDTVQDALETIDTFDLEDSFKGPWNTNTTYRGGQSVVHNGLEYISLIDGNTREPTHSEEQWSGQPRGYIYRGDAPVTATTYQESHIVRVPAQNSYYICTFQGGVSVTRTEIAAGHANFNPLTHRLTDAQVGNGSSTEQGTISGEQLDDFAPELGIAEATSKVSDEFGRVSGRRLGEAIDAHVVPSTNATTDIGTTSDIGTSEELSRDDHVHRLPTDNTLTFNSSDELSVNVQDVIEHLQERIRYFAASHNYTSDAGASVGQAYTTSSYRKIITKVEVDFDPLVGADSFLVRLVELEDNNEIKAKLFTSNTRNGPFGAGAGVRSFTFHDAAGDPGVTINKGIRLGILLSRLEDDSDSAVAAAHGSEASGSPNETYDDASTDFNLVNGVVYQHIDPAIGASTHSHDTQIRGNIKIFYTLVIDHGNLVGDGNVNADHIDSGSAADGDVLTADGSGGSAFETPTGGGGGGALTQATETTLGGVRGASALQAISVNGTDILAWSINRIRQLVSVALPAMTQTDIDDETTTRKSITGALIADNIGGGTSTELTQTQVEDETDTTFGTVSGERLSQAVAEFESSSSGTSPDRIVLANAVAVTNTAGPHEITLTEAMVARQLITFYLATSGATNPDVVGYFLSDDILDLTAEATAPSDAENGLSFTTTNYTQTSITSQGGNYYVYRKDDSTLWVRPTRLLTHTLTITATPFAGGGLSTSEQTSLSNARVLRLRDFNGLGNGIATPSSGTSWPTNSPNIFVVTATEYADIERLEFVFRQNGKVDLPFIITKGILDEITAGAYMPNDPSDSTRIRGIFYSGRVGPSQRNVNYFVLNPRFDFMEERRNAGDNCILIQYGLNGTLFTSVYIRARQGSGSLVFQGAKLGYWEDA